MNTCANYFVSSTKLFCFALRYLCFLEYRGGGLQPKKNPKNRKKTEKTSPKCEICGSVRFFSVSFGIFRVFSVFFGFFSGFLSYFFGFFGLNFDKKFQPFKNHVNNEILGGQELPNNTLNALKALQMSYKSYYRVFQDSCPNFKI